jgi:hypothetical protein
LRKAGADPTGNIKRIMGMLEEQTGGKFTPKQAQEVDFATEVITGNAFAVIDQKLPVAMLILNSCSKVLVKVSVSPNILLCSSHLPVLKNILLPLLNLEPT